MSNKVFITKYQASIDKDLPVLGQMVIHVTPLIDKQKKNDTSIASALGITVSFSTPTELEIIGDSYFTNGTNGESIGKKITVGSKTPVFFKEGTFDILIKNKYALTYYVGCIENAENGNGSTNKYFDIDDLNYSTDLTGIRGNYVNTREPTYHNAGKTNGDISSLSNLTKLTSINFDNTSVSGNISSLSNLTNLTNISLGNTSVSGNISSLSNLTNLAGILLDNNSAITGDISSLSNLTNLNILYLSRTSVTGDITNIVTNLTKLIQLWLPKTVTITDEQKKTLTDRGCTVVIQ